MRIFITIVFASLWIGVQKVSSQGYQFKILANKGDNLVKTESSEWGSLKTGQELQEADQLKLVDDAYVGLMHNSGKTLELQKAGTYKISSLLAKLENKSSSVASKYVDFVVSRISDEGGSTNYTSSMGATGAVDRALASGASIKLLALSSSEIISDQIILRWTEPEQDEEKEKLEYELVFSNLFDETVSTAKVDVCSYLLDWTSVPFQKQNFIKVKIRIVGTDLESDDYAISIKPKKEAESIKASLKELNNDLANKTAMNNIIVAAFYEEHDLLLEALTAYEEAIQMAPEVPAFEKAYENFLIRNGFRSY